MDEPSPQTLAPPLSAAPAVATWWLTRFVILRMLGLVYLTAFLVAANQIVPLIGHHGLTPVDALFEFVKERDGGAWKAFWEMPTIFYFNCSDGFLQAMAWTGVVLSALLFCGFANMPLMLVLWALYMSFIHAGAPREPCGIIWYGYGWETQLLETGFLGALLCPMLDPRPFASRAPPLIILWLYRWLIFRIMVGAFLIKWRGDECWRDYTALYYHYETQPVPNPVSRYLHFAPHWFQRFGVQWNHFVEAYVPALAFIPALPLQKYANDKATLVVRIALGVTAVALCVLYGFCRSWFFSLEEGGDPSRDEPWLLDFYLLVGLACCAFALMATFAELPRLWKVLRFLRHTAGVILVGFQVVLIVSGNLSFLNWLTIIPGLACMDDSFWRRVLPGFLVRRSEQAIVDEKVKRERPWHRAVHWTQIGLATAFTVLAANLSHPVVQNLVKLRQEMNASLSPLAEKYHFVNTYGAFGSIGRVRDELVFEGTDDFLPNEAADWREYEFKVKPGDVMRRPAIISPYHHRLDWQIWFAAMGTWRHYPWTLSLVWHLLHNDADTLRLMAKNPFPDKPPRYIRVLHYRYKYAPPGNPEGAWWTRERVEDWLPPLSLQSKELPTMLQELRWLPADSQQ